MKVLAFCCGENVLSRPSIIWREVETALALGLMVASIPGMRSWLKKIQLCKQDRQVLTNPFAIIVYRQRKYNWQLYVGN